MQISFVRYTYDGRDGIYPLLYRQISLLISSKFYESTLTALFYYLALVEYHQYYFHQTPISHSFQRDHLQN
jgi:hypothetical protein